MKTTDKPTKLNKAQLYILQLFERVKSEQELEDIKEMISKYFAHKADLEMERMLKENETTPEKWLSKANEHKRTPYK